MAEGCGRQSRDDRRDERAEQAVVVGKRDIEKAVRDRCLARFVEPTDAIGQGSSRFAVDLV
jgi:hypothetical protein